VQRLAVEQRRLEHQRRYVLQRLREGKRTMSALHGQHANVQRWVHALPPNDMWQRSSTLAPAAGVCSATTPVFVVSELYIDAMMRRGVNASGVLTDEPHPEHTEDLARRGDRRHGLPHVAGLAVGDEHQHVLRSDSGSEQKARKHRTICCGDPLLHAKPSRGVTETKA